MKGYRVEFTNTTILKSPIIFDSQYTMMEAIQLVVKLKKGPVGLCIEEVDIKEDAADEK